MNNLKRTLALMLVLCMVCSVLPVGVLAAEDDIGHMATKPADGTSANEPFPENTGGSYSFRIPAMVTLSDGTIVAAADARWNTTYDGGGLDTIVARSTNGGTSWSYTFANYLGDNGNEYNGSSTCFIDPSLAVLTTDEDNDGVGEDTIFMLCDLYPYGVALNGNKETTPSTAVGFNDDGKLLLSANSHTSYDYYLDGDTIYSSNGTAVSGYTVDEYFNVFQNGTYVSNLFFSDSPYKVVRTGYLYLTTSTDGGASWSAPTLLNLKTDQEMVCLVGPGRGLVTSSGTIVFPIYGYAGETSKYTGLIYSEDNGATWKRTTTFSEIISSEATMVELDNGNIRTFFRNDNATLCYADYKLGTNGMTDGWWGTYVNTGVKANSDTELSAIMYTKTVDGQQVILVSAPAGPNAAGSNDNNGAYRSSGKIFAGLLKDDDDFTMTWLDSSVAVTNVATSAFSGSTYTAEQGFFAYSCLTELDDGSVAILYEDNQYGWGQGDGYGYTMNYKTYTESDLETALGVSFDDDVNTDVEVDGDNGDAIEKNVTVKVNGTYTETITGTYVADDTYSDTYVDVTWVGTEVSEGGTTETLTAATLPTSAGSIEAYISDGNGNYLTLSNGALTNATSAADATKWTILFEDTPNWETNTNGMSRYNVYTTINNVVYYIDGDLALTTSDSNNNFWYTAENGFFGGMAGTNGWYFDGTNWTINSTGYGNAKAYTVETVTGEASASTAVTITGKAVGTTTVKVGDSITYNITVNADVANTVDVELKVGQTLKFTESSGAYTTATTNPDGTIVKMELTPVAATEKSLVEVTSASFEAGKQYVIVSKRAATNEPNYSVLTSDDSYNSTAASWISTGNGLVMNGPASADSSESWTITPSGSGYTISVDGNYLNLANNAASMSTTASVMTMTYDAANGWTIYDGNYYLSDLAGTTLQGAYGYASADPGNYWTIYEVQGNAASTEVSFTGLKEGETIAVVGNTQYNITVKSSTVNIELEVGETFTYTDTTGNYVGSDTIEYPNTTYASMTVAAGKTLKAVTTLESGKQYLIVNKANGTILTDTEMTVTGDYGNKDGLATTGTPSADSKELWTITVTDDGYTVVQNGQYLTVAGFYATMSETATNLTLTYTDNGWTIYDDETTTNVADVGTGGYYLSDNVGNNYVNGALGTNDTANTYMYWEIYEIVETQTELTFTGNAIGETQAVVGSTTYNITVEAYVLDDEIHDNNTGYTVNAELQRSRYNELINGVTKDLYTDESWPAYETARKEAFALLNQVDGTTYATETEAEEALAELIAAIDALEAAKAKLVAAKTISINYQLSGTTVLTENYKIAATATTLTLPETIVANNVAYSIADTQTGNDVVIADGVMTLNADETNYNVAVDKIGALGNGFVASDDISADDDYVGTGAQIADLVDKDDDGNVTFAHAITEMTLTTGVSVDINPADTLADGQTITWTSSNESVATVDENGLVTPVAAGTTTITATVKDADGNIVSVNSIPVTVFTRATTDRLSAVYIEEVENTTVYCVVNADTDAKAFEVIEGELIYGYFDTTVDDGTATTAFSFFGDPDEAHALVAMTSTNSFGDYYLLHDDDGNLGVGTEYYVLPDNNTGAGYWQAIGLTDNNHDGVADWTKIKAMVNWAIANGCDGGMGFTRRQSEGNIGTNLTFISDPMPKIDKEVNGVLPTSRKQADFRRYTEGMVAAVNELVYFKITITLERPTVWETDDDGNLVTTTDTEGNVLKYGAIKYTDALVEDTVLKGAYLYTKELDQADGSYDGEIDEAYRTQIQDITRQLNDPWADDETVRTIDLYLLYEIQESDIPKFYIDNIANLNYKYESHYSTGAQAGAADAEARISVVGTAIDNVVIDFGQSFVYEGHEYTSITDGNTYTFEGLTNTHLKGAYVDGENDIAGITASKATAKYGTVKVYREAMLDEDGNVMKDDKGYTEYTYTVTYTPTQILQDVDTVLIYGYGDNNQEKIINGFLVYPATTVYYEEGFMLDGNTGWDETYAKQATVNQTFELLGDSQFNDNGELTHKVSNKKHAYGYDPIYDDGMAADSKSYISATDVGKSTTFTFTGTGFELYANSKTSTGKVSAKVVNSEGKVVKMYIVNTVASEGYTGVTDGQNTNLDSLPIVAVKNLEHDTYTVTLSKVVADSGTIYIDGVRILNTVEDSSVFTIDQEDNPEFHHLRDYVLKAVNIDKNTSVDYPTMYDQVYAMLDADASAFIVSAEDPYANVDGETTVYLTTTVKTIETTQKYTDGTYSVTTRVDTTVEEYRDEARTELSKTKVDTEVEVVCYDANGNKTEFDVNSKVANGNPTSTITETTNDSEMQVTTAQDLLDNGPKNEIYLHQNEALVFNVKTSRVMQLGLKAPQGTAGYEITGVTNDTFSGTLNTSVDMFYELGNAIGTETEYTITVKNTGATILSVTDLKICDDPSAAFTALTEEDVKTALIAMGYCDHSYEAVVTDPTCIEAGYTTYTCDLCGDTYVGDETEALGHSHDAVVTEPTCTETGYTTYTCDLCGDTYVGDETEALGHSYDAVVTEPTCTETGYTTYTCTVCADTYVGDETEALGHSHEAVVTDPTCTEQGYTTYTCHCGDTYVGDYVDATGHDYSNGSCNDCGAKDPNSGSSGTVGQIISKIIGWIIGLINP